MCETTEILPDVWLNYVQGVTTFAIQSSRLHVLWEVLDILCTNAKEPEYASNAFVQQLQQSSLQAPMKLWCLTQMAKQVIWFSYVSHGDSGHRIFLFCVRKIDCNHNVL